MSNSPDFRAVCERLRNPEFSRAFCAKPGFKYDALRKYSKDIVFVTDGIATDLFELGTQISEALEQFDPTQDCLIPTGTAVVNLMIGYKLRERFPREAITVGFYRKEMQRTSYYMTPEDYTFYRVSLGALLQTLQTAQTT